MAGYPWEGIVIHHSLTKDGGTLSWQAIRRYHVETLGWTDIGYHVGIELVNDRYEALLGRPLDQIGAHVRSHNRDQIGVCLVGNFDLAPAPDGQWTLAVKTVAALLRVLDLPTDSVRGHRDFSAKTCPGSCFDLMRFRADLSALV